MNNSLILKGNERVPNIREFKIRDSYIHEYLISHEKDRKHKGFDLDRRLNHG